MAIICGRQMGLDMPTLAKQFKTSKLVIWATLNTPNRSKTTGRPLKTSSGDDRIIVRMSKKNPRLTSTEINSELKDHYGVQVFKDTVKKRLRHALLFRRRPVNKPMIPDKNRSARLNDESKYLMIGTDGVTLVRRPGDKRNDPKYQVPTVKHCGGNVMVWGCFHANGIEIHFIEDNFIHAVNENQDSSSIEDLYYFQKAAQNNGLGREQFFTVSDRKSIDWMLYLLIFSNVLAFIYLVIAYTLWFSCEKKTEQSDSSGKNDEHKPSEVSVGDRTSSTTSVSKTSKTEKTTTTRSTTSKAE
uniref:HTH_Tnp_Tc3_2 domain-containing protein n=1 Tax=Caenorhabditis japonica TaxID=281687 RepID=A0A8R1HPS1_CAEJA